MGLVCNIITRVRHIIDAIFGAAYLIAFILLAVGCGHNKWIWFDPEMKDELVQMESPCHAGLWQVCCPESVFKEKETEIKSLWDDDFECKPYFDVAKMEYQPFANRNSFFDGQLWTIRAFMLAASVMPLVAAGSRLCGSYLHALIFMIISGLFGAVVIFTSFFFAYEYFAVEEKDSSPNTEFPFIQIGPSFLCVISGTAIIWLFSFIDLILLGRIFNQAKEAVGTVENPYSDETTNEELAEEL